MNLFHLTTEYEGTFTGSKLKMKFKPHDYQLYCIYRMMEEPRLGLFLNMGLGKTVISLTAVNEMIFYQKTASKVLVIAPKRVAETTWSDEKDKWDHLRHLRISKILGPKEKRLKAAKADADIYITNRENVFWLVDNFRKEWKWDTVIIDELSSFKNHRSKRFKALKKMLPHIHRLYGLTGTPAANGLIDLWSQIYLLDGGERLYKTIGQYRSRFFDPDRRNAHVIFSYKPKPGADKAIRERISDICISLKSRDYVELPECVYHTVNFELSPKAKKAYIEMERESVLELADGEITAFNAGVLTNKLLQIASGSVYDSDGQYHIIHEEKIEILEEIIEEAVSPVLVFYNFAHERDMILKLIDGARVLKDESDLKEWNTGGIPVLLAHPASCGYGLNMQDGGHTVVWFSPTWNLEQYEQANARINRQGQKEIVTVSHIIAKGTVDELVMKALSGKEKVQTTLLEELERKYKELKDGK